MEDPPLYWQWPVCLVSHLRRVHKLPVHPQKKEIIVNFHQTGATTIYKPEGHYTFYYQNQDHTIHSNIEHSAFRNRCKT